MSPSRIGLVLGKELRETLRDRRTLIVMVLVPLVIYPLIGLGTAEVLASRVKGSAAHASRVAVSGADADAVEAVRKILRASPAEFALQPSGGDAEVAAGDLDAAVVVARATATAPAPAAVKDRTAPAVAQVLYDETHDDSNKALERLEHAFGQALPARCEPAFAVRSRSVAPRSKIGGYALSKVLPMMVVLMVMIGAFYPAIDITAGEHERGTLETILSSPVDRADLMAGKVLAASTLAALGGVLNLASLSLTMLEGVRLAGARDIVSIPWGRALATLLTVFPTAFLFGSLMVAIGAMARSLKEAQTLLTPVYFLCAAPTFIAGIGDTRLRGPAMLVPGMNVTLLARDLVLGEARVGPALVVLASTLVYGALALLLAARLYDSERLLVADESGPGLRRWLGRLLLGDRAPSDGTGGAAGPSAGAALALFGIAFVLLYYVLFPLQKHALLPGLLVSEWGGLLGLVVVYARATGQRLGDVLRLRRPSAQALGGAALVGVSAWLVVGLVVEWIAPVPKEVVDHLRREIAPGDGSRGLVVTLLAMALTPAICEEALFRGPILRGLATRLTPLAAAAVTGLLFGLFHADVWRVIPTGLLGFVLSLVALRAGSIVPAMLAHFLNNACLVTLAYLRLDDRVTELDRGVQLAMFATGALVLAAGARMLWRGGAAAKP